MSNIFISYNRQSEAIARTLANDIEELGHTVWLDQQLSGGQAWWNQILAQIRDCDLFVFVLDPEALNSTACKREYDYAANLGKPILPILVTEGVSMNLLPPALGQIQFVDYRKQDRNAAFRLARAITTVPPAEPLPDPLPAPPEVPISYLGSLGERIETLSTLSYEEQSSLVVDLKRSWRDPGTTDDTRILLGRLRKRRDLFATIAEEIDELLGSVRKASSAPSGGFEMEPSSSERKTHTSPSASKISPPVADQSMSGTSDTLHEPTAGAKADAPGPTRRLLNLMKLHGLATVALSIALWISVFSIFGSPVIGISGAILIWLGIRASVVNAIITGALSVAIPLLTISLGPMANVFNESSAYLPYAVGCTMYCFIHLVMLWHLTTAWCALKVIVC